MSTSNLRDSPSRPRMQRSPSSDSEHSDSPLRALPEARPAPSYPPPPNPPPQAAPMPGTNRKSRHIQLQMPTESVPRSPPRYDAEHRAQTMPVPEDHQRKFDHSGGRSASWDLLAGIKKFEHSYEEFDTRNASEAHLAFAEGDTPTNGFAKFYHYLLNVSIVTRWFLFIVPVMALLWIPGIVGETSSRNAVIWSVKLLWWSIWLSVVWGGWWGALAASMIVPHFIRHTVGMVAVGSRRYIDWLEVLRRYIALSAWTLVCWISFQPLIVTRQQSSATTNSKQAINLISKLLFAFFLCAAILTGEKFAIQWIAGKFHERSYAERIADQKRAVGVLSVLYRHSSDIPGRSDTLKDTLAKRASTDPKKFFKRAIKGVRNAATTTTTALGNVASEIAGSSVLQPNSPQAKVQTALESANKSRLLARRLYYSFTKPGAEYMVISDISKFFTTMEEAQAAFGIFDKDSNGDVTRDELEASCLEFHREQLSIEHSMQDLDSAVGRLDNILMSVYCVVAVLIIAVALEAQLVTLITGAGSLFLGLSWLIGGSLQEVLTSIIFLFVKHPYDVGDRVQVGTDIYTVKEIRLLSTIFLDVTSCYVQAPNMVLSTQYIQNMRRSPQMSEPFKFDVEYSTSFEQIESLRTLMLAFLESQRRDFQPVFDVLVVDIPEQTSMKLKVDIKYKSNCQLGAMKSRRRNLWICALKLNLEKAKIFGPGGDPGAKAAPAAYTLVPWDQVQQEQQRNSHVSSIPEPRIPEAWKFSDHNAVQLDANQDIFGEQDELNMSSPKRGPSAASSLRQRPAPVAVPTASAVLSSRRSSLEVIEMQTPRPGDTFKR